ncbi:MAG: alpha/beta fold hydrolase [Candidatus Methanoperedens sp.]|nr:alpha/beta fold hydrolase [Candidatus Methanoperedens sp.]
MTINMDNIQITRSKFFNELEGIFPPTAVGKTPCEIVDEDSRFNFKLLRYGKEKDSKRTLLLVPHIINRPYILDLNDDISVIRKFCEHGFSVYMLDWGYPTMKQRKISFSDYVDYLDRAVDFICQERGVKRISVLGYCTGGIISLMYASLHPEKMEKLILLATPVDFSNWYDPRILWGKVFDVRSTVSLFGNVPGELILLFGRNLFMYYFPFFSMSAEFNKEFLTYESWRDALRINRWFIDTPMIPGSTYIQFIEDCYQRNLLINNKMRIDSQIVDLRKIHCPLLNILAKYDHIVPLAAGKALKDVYPEKSYEEIVFPSSHIGLSVSREAHLNLWPKVCEWVARTE